MKSVMIEVGVFTLLIEALSTPGWADLLAFEGSVSFTPIPGIFPTATGFEFGGAGVGVSTTAPNLISGFTGVTGFTGTATTYAGGTGSPPTLYSLRVTGIGSPEFSGTPLEGPLAVRGLLRAETAFSGAPLGTLPLTLDGTRGLGLGGSITPYSVPVRFGRWTTGNVQLTGILTSTFGGGTTTISLSGFDARSAQGLGTLQLVTPLQIGPHPAAPMSGAMGGFAVLELQFVPEPASLALLGFGALAVFVLGCRRARS